MKMLRVTDILSPWINYEMIPGETLAEAQTRGTAVHLHLKCYALGLWAPMPREYAGYCESGERWISNHVRRVILVEEELSDTALGFCGHPDLVATTDMGLLLVDYKTPATESRSWPLQLAAYHHLVNKKQRFGGLIPGALMLHGNGGPAKMKRYDDRLDYYLSRFLYALELKKHFGEGK